MRRKSLQSTFVICCLLAPISNAVPQAVSAQAQASETNRAGSTARLSVEERIAAVLESSPELSGIHVEITTEGKAILTGAAADEAAAAWAEETAKAFSEVALVSNRLRVSANTREELEAAFFDLSDLIREMLRFAPRIVFALLLVFLSLAVSSLVYRLARGLLKHRIDTALLRSIMARMVSLLFVLLGIYLALRVAGLTNLAVTVLGGTGVAGLIVGLAFRDIAENFLASLLLTLQRPFRPGDIIEIEGHVGMVELMTIRCTVIMTYEGDHVQIPNATIFKSNITNLTTNPRRRQDFTVGIGYDASIQQAQEFVKKLLDEHPGVLKDPEPWVLAEELCSSTVQLRVYFWVDIVANNPLKVRSSVIRVLKATFEAEGISMPDDARERIFPEGIDLRRLPAAETAPSEPSRPARSEAVLTSGESSFTSNDEDIKQQIRSSPSPTEGADLLSPGKDSGG